MNQPIVIYTFAGREPNMRLLIPFMERILADNPDAQWDIWNLCREPSDAAYLQTISGDRITVRNDYYNPSNWWAGLTDVWKHYATDAYAGTIFCKTDDDTAFVESGRFSEFIDTVRAFPNHVTSAAVVNNGASTRLFSGIQQGFDDLDVPLLDVHMSNDYAEMAHQWFIENWRDAINSDSEPVDTDDWVSINWIAFTHELGKRIAGLVGQLAPPHIAGRDWPPGSIIGDEGAVNMLPRLIDPDFVVAHTTFGPQHCSDEQQDRWRSQYTEIAAEYLV